MKLSIQARAKINWTLDVVGTLPNGYHDLDMLMQSVTLCDQLTIEDAPECTLSVRMQGGFVPADGNNLVLRAARALQEATGETRGARMTLRKYIPVAAGMGGGSSDAAAARKGRNVLWNLGLTDERLEEIGLTIGADVPFCIRGGLQRARGVGERLTPLPLYTYHVYAVMLAGFALLFIDHVILLLRRLLEQKDPSLKLRETKVQ